MKLASEIVGEINPFIDDRHNSEGFNVMEHVESIIAAKLEPVRRMVLDLVRVGNDMAAIPSPPPEIEISESRAMIMTPQAQWAELCKHDAPLALLSEEE